MTDDLPDVGTFGAAFSEFIESMSAVAQARESPLLTRLREHLGAEPKELPLTSAEFSPTDHPNLQLAIDGVLPDAEVVGIAGVHPGWLGFGLNELFSGHAMVGRVEPGPAQYTDVEVGDGRVIRCVSMGFFLVHRDGAPVVLFLAHADRRYGQSNLRLEGVSPAEGAVSALLAELRAAMREHNVYRGQTISFHQGDDGSIRVEFHRLSPIGCDAVVLPEGTIERLERHAIGVSRHAERLSAAGRQLKRGVLLHGPPGTGKTLTVSYLLGAMPGRTTVLLTGRSLGLIDPAMAIARELVPATVVLEDVDLVAAERTMEFAHGGILFELLNQMEGLAEDSDLLFLLTTNRADLIEPALATRPGRVDLALEIPLPDEAARAKLVRLYAKDVPLDEPTERDLVARTDRLSGAFIKELMRQAALRAALEDRPAASADAADALTELLEERSTLTRKLLGESADGSDAAPPRPAPYPEMQHALRAAGVSRTFMVGH